MFSSRARISLLSLGFVTLLSLGLASLAGGDQPKKDDPAAADKEKIDSKATRRTTAASVKFRKELGLPLATLNTLGPRIDAAPQGARPRGAGQRGQRTRRRRKGHRERRRACSPRN